MTILLKLLYAAAITTLFVLLVAFGIRTFYGPPDEPDFPRSPIESRPAEPKPGTPPAEPQGEKDQYERYQDELSDYHVIVFVVSALVGVLAIAGGVALSARLDALRLGLVGGGLGTLLYGVLQAGGDLDELGAAAVFIVVAIGLLVIGAAGYRWLATQET